MIHTIARQLCSKCNALMAAQVEKNIVTYVCINKHELHPPERFRDKANGE